MRAIGARQDLHLDDNGHSVSVLFNRPVEVPQGDDIRDKFTAEAHVAKDGIDVRANRPIPGAALQEDGRIVNVNFDHALSVNAEYEMEIGTFIDPISDLPVTFGQVPQFKIDNDRPGAILYGQVLQGNNTPIADAEVRLYSHGSPQYDFSADADGSYLFEFVPRDADENIGGQYTLEAVTVEGKKTAVEGAVRLPGRVHRVNLVFLGRGSAEGFVKYTTGEKIANANVTIGSTMFNQFRTARTDENGFYHVDDLPVGPLTFSATDDDGNVTYARRGTEDAGTTADAGPLHLPAAVPRNGNDPRARPALGYERRRGRRARRRLQPGLRTAGRAHRRTGTLRIHESAGGIHHRPGGGVERLARKRGRRLRPGRGPDPRRDAHAQRHAARSARAAPRTGYPREPALPGRSEQVRTGGRRAGEMEKGPIVVADENGNYSYQAIPTSWGGHKHHQAYDPQTSRSASTQIPQLNPTGENIVNIFISTADGFGNGDIRVRLLNAAGNPVTGYRVIEPGIPVPIVYPMEEPGVYVRRGVAVGPSHEVWAVPPSSTGPYGDQYTAGGTKVEFNGHTAALTLRLPGQGMVRAALQADIALIGDVTVSYSAWDEAEQETAAKRVTVSHESERHPQLRGLQQDSRRTSRSVISSSHP